MSFLKDLIDKARSYLGARPETPVQHTDSIKHDRFDARMFDELLEEAPALTEMVEDLNEQWDYTDDMVRDVLMEFWQGDPVQRGATDMKPGWLTNHAVSGHVLGSPETDVTRGYTVHDRYGAAMATLAVNEKVREFLENYGEEAQEAAKEAAKAEESQTAAQADLDAAIADAEAQEWPEIGPPSPDAQAAADALAQAVAVAMQADADMEAAEQDAQDAAANAKARLAGPVNDAIREVGEQLEEEAEQAAAWGIEPGTLQRMSFKERQDLAARLRQSRLAEFIKIVGRFKMMAAAQRTKKVEYGRDEVVDVELSDDLTRVVPVELAYFAAHPALRRDFLVRFAEGQLLSRKFAGIERVGKGAIICCIDCSGSMEAKDHHGVTREVWAKAMGLALLDQARQSRRDFVGILFSSRGQTAMFDFPRGQGSLDDVMAFTETFWGGGTDFEEPLDKAIDKLKREFNTDGKMKGDIVFVTDGTCGVSDAWMQKYQATKNQLGFRTFGIQVGSDNSPGWGYAGDTLERISDNVRKVIEFADPDIVADIFRVVE